MSTTLSRRLLARPGLLGALESAGPARRAPAFLRPISSTPVNHNDKKNIASSLFSRSPSSKGGEASSGIAMANLSKVLGSAPAEEDEATFASLTNELAGRNKAEEEEPYHFHVYSHKHNTHVTVTKPNRDAIISLSCGNIGFKKSRRKQYDAAYQLTVYVLERLYDAGWDGKIDKMEVVLRGFGAGREAATKVLLGTEGTRLRDKIVRVADATKIKFGGTRSDNPRRV